MAILPITFFCPVTFCVCVCVWSRYSTLQHRPGPTPVPYSFPASSCSLWPPKTSPKNWGTLEPRGNRQSEKFSALGVGGGGGQS